MRIFNTLTAAIALITITACSTGGGDPSFDDLRPYVTFGVLSTIENSEELTGERVLEVVAEIRATADLDGEITAQEFMAVINSALDLSTLQPSERFIATEVMVAVEKALGEYATDHGEVSATADMLLTWVELAARMSI